MLEVIKHIMADFHQCLPFTDVKKRELNVPLDSGKIVTIMGPRRSGKTFFLRSIINGLLDEISHEQIVYVNFEDERLSVGPDDLQSILDAHLQLYPDVALADCWFFFDEIQLVRHWQRFVRRLAESVSKHIFITGSSAKLLSREIATSLRGRTIPYTLLPLSFREYARFRGEDVDDIDSTKNRNRLAAIFDRFLVRGGYPEVIEMNEELHRRVLQTYEDIMIFRDVIERYQLSRPVVAKDLMKRLLANTARTFSVNKYYNELKSANIAIGKDTLYDLLDHLTDAFNVFLVRKWATSQPRRRQALKKVYAPDTGMVTACTYRTSEDLGYLLETAVFLELAKREHETFYFVGTSGECDFVSKQGVSHDLIQVCYELTADNRGREIAGIIAAAQRLDVCEGLILTHHQEDRMTEGTITIRVKPAWQWAVQLP